MSWSVNRQTTVVIRVGWYEGRHIVPRSSDVWCKESKEIVDWRVIQDGRTPRIPSNLSSSLFGQKERGCHLPRRRFCYPSEDREKVTVTTVRGVDGTVVPRILGIETVTVGVVVHWSLKSWRRSHSHTRGPKNVPSSPPPRPPPPTSTRLPQSSSRYLFPRRLVVKGKTGGEGR